MDISFNELEERILRYLAKEYLKNGSQSGTLDGQGTTFHSDVMKKYKLEYQKCREIIARLEHHEIVKSLPVGIDEPTGFLEISPKVVDIVYQLDEKAKQLAEAKPELPNRIDEMKKYFYSKPWFVGLCLIIIVLGIIASLITDLKTILNWFRMSN